MKMTAIPLLPIYGLSFSSEGHIAAHNCPFKPLFLCQASGVIMYHH